MTVFMKNATEEIKAYDVELKKWEGNSWGCDMLLDWGCDMLFDMGSDIGEYNNVISEEEFDDFVEFWKEEAKAMTENEPGELLNYSKEPDAFEYKVFIKEIA